MKMNKKMLAIALASSFVVAPTMVATPAFAAEKYIANCKSNVTQITSATVFVDKKTHKVVEKVRLYGKYLTCSYMKNSDNDLVAGIYVSPNEYSDASVLNFSKGSGDYLELTLPYWSDGVSLSSVSKKGKLTASYRSYHSKTPGKATSKITKTKYKNSTVKVTLKYV